MRFLHTSDWHVGKQLRNHKRDDEYAAALAEVLDIAKRMAVDCVLVAGDVFDSAVPTPEAERIVFNFFGELVGAGIPAVVIAGNHDHPRRWSAYAPVLRHIGIEVLGEPATADDGGIIQVQSRDGSETAAIAALPWVSERKVRDFESLMVEGKHSEEYADGVALMMDHLCSALPEKAVRILLAHAYISGAVVGPESGERPLHIGDVYAVAPQRLPQAVHYAALGHVHNPDQPALRLTNAQYSGSLLQCDFGEAGQKKRVNIVEASARKRAKVEAVELSAIRQLRNIGSHRSGVTLDELGRAAEGVSPLDYVKVWVKVDRPLPGLAEQVRDILPNAVDVVVERTADDARAEPERTAGMSPADLFAAYHRAAHNDAAPAPELMALFNRLYEEASGAPD